MATSSGDFGFGQTHPGHSYNVSPATKHFPGGSVFMRASSNRAARTANKVPFQGIGDGVTYSTLDWTATTTGTGAAAALNTGGGVLLTAGSDSTFNTNLQSKNLFAPGVGKKIQAWMRVQTSDITTVGFDWSFGTSAVDPSTTNYTDCIKFKMTVGAGTVVGRVRGGSGTEAASATLYTMAAATDAFFGFNVDLGTLKSPDTATTVTTGASSTTQTVGSTKGMQPGDVLYFATTAVYAAIASITDGVTVVLGASISTTTAEIVTVYGLSGSFWAGSSVSTAVETPFTAAQLVQLARIVRASPSMYHNISAKGSASNPTVLVGSAQMERDL